MIRYKFIQTNFTGGEISPRLMGRIDIERYYNSLADVNNFLVLPQGGISRRPGTMFISEVKNSTKKVRLIPFQFSTEQQYVLEFGENYVRFYMDEGQIISAGVPYEITTPYSEAQLDGLYYTQSADILYLCHKDHSPKQLTRTGHTSWTLSDFDYIDGPYIDRVSNAVTLTPSSTTGTITITASASTFVSTDVNRAIRIRQGTTWGCAKITAYTSATAVTAIVQNNFANTSASTTWKLGAWSPTTGWPSIISFHGERLCFANTRSQPQTIWLSQAGLYNNFGTTDTTGAVLATSAITFTIGDDQVNAIQWISSGKTLLIGSSEAEYSLQQASTAEPLSPTNIEVPRQTNFGSAAQKVVRVGSTTLFIQRSKLKIIEYAYFYDRDGFDGSDATIFSEHITYPGITEFSYQQEPNSIVWMVRTDGKLVGLTYNKDQKVFAFHKHDVSGEVESICNILSTSKSFNQLWAVVKRGSKRYIEVMTQDFGNPNNQEKTTSWFVDCGLRYTGTATATITGLSHLEGKTVAVVVDGSTHKNVLVTSGSITLDRPGSNVLVGLDYQSTFVTVPIEQLQGNVTEATSKKRGIKIGFRYFKSITGSYSNDGKNYYDLFSRSAADKMDESPALKTGYVSAVSGSGWDPEPIIYFRTNTTMPLNLLSIVHEIDIP